MYYCTKIRWVLVTAFILIVLISSHPVIATTTLTDSSSAPRFPTSPSDSTLIPDQPWFDQASQPDIVLAALIQQSELIVRGRVTAVQSFWDSEHRLIESMVTVRVAYSLLGDGGHTVMLRAPGGYLADEGIGMVSMHAATFTTDEEVLLFLQQRDSIWQMTKGAAGKFLAHEQRLVNDDGAFSVSVDGLLATIMTISAKHGAQPAFSSLWLHGNSNRSLSALPTIRSQSGIHKWPMPHATATYHVNVNASQLIDSRGASSKSGQGPTAEGLRDAIIAAATQWSGVNGADFTLRYGGPTHATTTGYNGVNEILFMSKGRNARAAAAEVWYTADMTIVEADIWINDDYRWETTDTPPADAVDLQSALLHEFGHWLILGHFAEAQSIMYPKLTSGHVKRTLHTADIAGISTIYPQ